MLEALATDEPDLILLDLHMPGMDGFAVLRELAAMPGQDRYLPVVVLSADAERGRRDQLIAGGAFGYLNKPLDVGDFLAIVDRLAAHGMPPQ